MYINNYKDVVNNKIYMEDKLIENIKNLIHTRI